ENVVRNNVFAFGTEHQLMRSRAEPHISFFLVGNIVLWGEGELLGSVWDDRSFVLDRNLYFRTKPGEWKFAKWTFEEWKAKGQDVHSAIGDPLFADAAAFDFRLRPESPALKMGFRPIDLRDVGPRAARDRSPGASGPAGRP